MRIPLLSLLLLATLAVPAQARMYQWVDPQSGTTQLSGKPPAWYRSDSGGPRVFVFEAGVLVDDTARAVPADRREALRGAAFQAAMAAEGAAAEARRLRATLDAEQAADAGTRQGFEDEVAALAAALDAADDVSAAVTEPVPEAASESTVTRLKAIIENWDRQQTQRARQLLESDDLMPSP